MNIFKFARKAFMIPAAAVAVGTAGYNQLSTCEDPCSLSGAGATIIKEFEGYRDEVYLDAAGYPTIAWGYKIPPSMVDDYLEGISKAEAEKLFWTKVRQFEDAVNDAVEVPLCQSQYDALVSLTYNIGPGAFQDSTLLRLLNDGDYEGAAKEFPKWRKAGGRVLAGLVNRRSVEKNAFLACTVV